MPARKGNKTAQRSDEGPSTKGVLIRLTPREHLRWSELADALQVKMAAMVRDAVRDYRVRALAAGMKLKKER